MKTCLFCQTPVEDNVSHCPACGAAIPSDFAYSSSAPEDAPAQTPPPVPNAASFDKQPAFAEEDVTKPFVTPPKVDVDDSPNEQSSEIPPAQTEESTQKPHRFKQLFAALVSYRRRIFALAIAFVVGVAAGAGSFLLISHAQKPPAVTVASLESMADQIAEQYAALIPEEDSDKYSLYIDEQETSSSYDSRQSYIYTFIGRQQAVSYEYAYGSFVGSDYNEDGIMDSITFTFPYSSAVNNEESQTFYRVFAALVEKLTPFDPHQIWAPSEEEPNWDIGKTADDSADTNSRRTIRLTTDSCYLSMYYSYSGNSDMVTNLYLNPQAIFASGWLY